MLQQAINQAGAIPPIAPGDGTVFDHHIEIRDPEGEVLVERILELYASEKQVKRYLSLHKIRVRKLVANALRGFWFRQPSSIRYYRKADARAYEDKPRWMRHGALAEAVDIFEAIGLVTAITGKRMPFGAKRRSWMASFQATEKLVLLSNECGVSAASIRHELQADELVRLFGPKPFQARKGPPVTFLPTVETQKWTAELKAINAFYRAQRLALNISADDLAAWNAEKGKVEAGYRLQETFRTDLYRVFNDGVEANPNFSKGGRLNGGWWMSVPEPLRTGITINDLSTVELDYAECHPRMLYHQKGLVGPDEIYTLPEIAAYEEANGLPTDTFRPCIKWAMQVLINSKGRPNKAEQPEGMVFPLGYPLDEVLRLLEIKHQPIAAAFKTGAGLRLMRVESDIALEIVSTATTEGWTVLPIHDSFVATTDRKERLTSLMVEAYFSRFAMSPAIKNKGKLWNHFWEL